jgi:hypothetical protein
MKTCPDHVELQDYLEDELSEPRRREIRVHAEGCVRCTGELSRYRRAFAALDHIVLASPPAALTERVLGRVLPSRIRRRRFVAVLGFGYGAAFAAFLAGFALWAANPAGRAMLETISAELSRRLVSSLIFTLNTLSFTVLSLANGWGLVSTVGARLAPFGRALVSLLSMPGIEVSLWLAAAACAGLLWWMRPRDKRSSNGMRHVGVLGF